MIKPVLLMVLVLACGSAAAQDITNRKNLAFTPVPNLVFDEVEQAIILGALKKKMATGSLGLVDAAIMDVERNRVTRADAIVINSALLESGSDAAPLILQKLRTAVENAQ